MWICGRGGRKCWIKPQSRKNIGGGGQNQGLNILSHRSRQGRNKHRVVKSHLSRQYEVELMELKNLMAKQQAE